MNPQPEARSAFRAEFILTAATVCAGVLVLGLLLLLWQAGRLQQSEQTALAEMRAARTAFIGMTLAQADAEAFATRFAATRNPTLRTAFDRAKADARVHAAEVRRIAGGDAAIGAQLDSLVALMDQSFTDLDREVSRRLSASGPERYIEFRQQGETLFAMLNARIDRARVAENKLRAQLNALAVVLALPSLIGSVLAILALRRERKHWRIAHAMAESARAKAAASDRSKTRFLAAASHDMRQPLHALVLYITALERRVESGEARNILTKMDRAARSMASMFSSLLDLARIQGGVITPEPVPFPVQEVLERIVAENPDAQVTAPASPLILYSDPALVERVLRNLVANALKHGGGAARIELSTRGDIAEIAVADNGPGIAPEDQERIFEEFVRLEGHGGAEGLGLGLAIVKRIAEILDAPLTLRSEPGAGARFTIRLPLARSPAPQPTPAPASTAALAGACVLVVDDDALAREAVAGVLRDLGAVVRIGASEAEAAAALTAGFRPGLLVMDLRLDGHLAGVDTARRLRDGLTPAPRVIIVTGDTEPATLALLRASGFAWLIKPVDPRALVETAAAQLLADAS